MVGVALAVAAELFENQLFVFSAAQIQAGIHASQFEYSMIALAYAVTAICMIFTQGHWVRTWGYRRFLIGSLVWFCLASLLCLCATNAWQLGAARVLQALGGGTLFTTTRVFLQTHIPIKKRAQAVRIYLMGVFGPSALAPLLASSSIQLWGWQAIFFIPVPLALLALLLLWPTLPPRYGKVAEVSPADLPLTSIGLVMLGIFSIQLALTEWRFNYFSGLGHIPLLLMVGIGLAWYFVWHQTRHPQPLLRLHELGNASYLMGLFFYFWYYLLSNSNAYVFPLFLEKALGYSFISAGLLLTITSLFGLLVMLAYFRYSSRLSSKRPFMVFALIAMSVYGVGMALLPADASMFDIGLLTAMRSVFTVLLVIPLAGLTFAELDEDIFAHGYQTKNILRQISATLAVSVGAVMVENQQLQHSVAAKPGFWSSLQLQIGNITGHVDSVWVISDPYRHALYLACGDVFRWQGMAALAILLILLKQKRLR